MNNRRIRDCAPRRHGRPAGILVGVANEDDWFDYRLEHDPRFLGLIASAGASIGTPRECPVGLEAERFVKIALVAFFKSRTVVTNLWIARRLQIGDPSMGSRYCAEIGTMWEDQ